MMSTTAQRSLEPDNLLAASTVSPADDSSIPWRPPGISNNENGPPTSSAVDTTFDSAKTALAPSPSKPQQVTNLHFPTAPLLPGFWTLPTSYGYPELTRQKDVSIENEEQKNQCRRWSTVDTIQDQPTSDRSQTGPFTLTPSYDAHDGNSYSKLNTLDNNAAQLVYSKSDVHHETTSENLEHLADSRATLIPSNSPHQNIAPPKWAESSIRTPTVSSGGELSSLNPLIASSWDSERLAGYKIQYQQCQVNARSSNACINLINSRNSKSFLHPTLGTTFSNIDNHKTPTYSGQFHSQLQGNGEPRIPIVPSITEEQPSTWHKPQLPQIYQMNYYERKQMPFLKPETSNYCESISCYGAHRQYSELQSLPRTHVYKGHLKNTGEVMVPSIQQFPTSTNTTIFSRPTASSCSNLERTLMSVPPPVQETSSSSPEPKDLQLRTYEADSTSTQLLESELSPRELNSFGMRSNHSQILSQSTTRSSINVTKRLEAIGEPNRTYIGSGYDQLNEKPFKSVDPRDLERPGADATPKYGALRKQYGRISRHDEQWPCQVNNCSKITGQTTTMSSISESSVSQGDLRTEDATIANGPTSFCVGNTKTPPDYNPRGYSNTNAYTYRRRDESREATVEDAARHSWMSSIRATPSSSSDENAALEEKRRRNREASARCEERRKWKTEQLKKDNQYMKDAALKLFTDNQHLWELLDRLKPRRNMTCGSIKDRQSETETN